MRKQHHRINALMVFVAVFLALTSVGYSQSSPIKSPQLKDLLLLGDIELLPANQWVPSGPRVVLVDVPQAFGLQSGDVIVGLDGYRIHDASELKAVFAKQDVAIELDLMVHRRGGYYQVEHTVPGESDRASVYGFSFSTEVRNFEDLLERHDISLKAKPYAYDLLPGRFVDEVNVYATRNPKENDYSWLEQFLERFVRITSRTFDAADNPQPARKLGSPIPYLNKLYAFYDAVELDVSDGSLEPDEQHYGTEKLFAGLYFPMSRYPIPSYGDLSSKDEEFAAGFQDAIHRPHETYWKRNAIASDRLPVDEGRHPADQYLELVKVSLIFPEKQGGWPTRASMIFKADIRKQITKRLDALIRENPENGWLFRYARLCLAWHEYDQPRVVQLFKQLHDVSPYMAHRAWCRLSHSGKKSDIFRPRVQKVLSASFLKRDGDLLMKEPYVWMHKYGAPLMTWYATTLKRYPYVMRSSGTMHGFDFDTAKSTAWLDTYNDFFGRMAVSESDLSEGLLAHYCFDNLRDGMVPNVRGNEHPGESFGASVVEVKGDDKALSVQKDGERSGYVEVADHKDFRMPAFTVSAWVKLSQTHEGNGSIVCKHDWIEMGSRGFVLRCYNAEGINFTVGAGGWMSANGTTPLPVHEWVHVAGTFDGRRVAVYYNGTLEGSRFIKKPYEYSPLHMRIGHAAFKLDPYRKFDGEIDDVMIWNRSLVDQEVHDVYVSQAGDKPVPPTAVSVAELIELLGSDKSARRKSAQGELIAFGPSVLKFVTPHLKTDDPEVSTRLSEIVERIKHNMTVGEK